MPADLEQFGRKDSYGTAIGGKGFVQLGHHPADGGGSLLEADQIAGIGQIQRGLHPRIASTDHHD